MAQFNDDDDDDDGAMRVYLNSLQRLGDRLPEFEEFVAKLEQSLDWQVIWMGLWLHDCCYCCACGGCRLDSQPAVPAQPAHSACRAKNYGLVRSVLYIVI